MTDDQFLPYVDLTAETEHFFNSLEKDSTIMIDEIPKQQETSYLAPEWSDYVLSQLDESELREGYPTVNGLRRITEILLGPIISSKPLHVTYVGDEVCCQYEVIILWKRNLEGNSSVFNEKRRYFGGVASSNERNNCDATFSKYHAAVAETRAEGRALRKALRLNTVFAEEIEGRSDAAKEQNEEITSIQKRFINNKCEILQLKLDELLTNNNLGDDLNKLTRNDAANLIRTINKIQTGRENA